THTHTHTHSLSLSLSLSHLIDVNFLFFDILNNFQNSVCVIVSLHVFWQFFIHFVEFSDFFVFSLQSLQKFFDQLSDLFYFLQFFFGFILQIGKSKRCVSEHKKKRDKKKEIKRKRKERGRKMKEITLVLATCSLN